MVVASHGVGAPGAILLFQELAEAGVRTIIRFGTAGAIRPGIADGDLVIAEAAVRDDGVTGHRGTRAARPPRRRKDDDPPPSRAATGLCLTGLEGAAVDDVVGAVDVGGPFGQ